MSRRAPGRRDSYAWWEYAIMAAVVVIILGGAVLLVRMLTSSDGGTATQDRPTASSAPVRCAADEWLDEDSGTCVPRVECAPGEVYDEGTNTCALPAPRPADVQPRSGPPEGGTTITIAGFDFQRGATVAVNGIPGVDVTVRSSSEITVVTPPSTVFYPVDIEVTNPDGQVGTLDNAFTYEAPEVQRITAIVPDTGSTQGGEAVLIKGRDFQPGAVVSFYGRPATEVEVLAPDTIRAVIPAAPEGRVSVNVRNPGEDAYTLDDAFTYVDQEPRIIAAVRPVEGPASGGTEITIRGSGFDGDADVTVGGQPARTVEVLDSTRITAVTPPGEVGPANVAVRNPDVPAMILPDAFTYLEAPVITGVKPARGPVEGGTRVVIAGTGFLDGAEVRFGQVVATDVRVVDDVTIRVVVPPAAEPGAVPVTVTNPGQPTATLKKAFTYGAGASAEPTPSPTRPAALPRCPAIRAPSLSTTAGSALVLTDADLFDDAAVRSPVLVDAGVASGEGSITWKEQPPRIEWQSQEPGAATITYAYQSPSCRGFGSGEVTVSAR